jgi:hypothetical protein
MSYCFIILPENAAKWKKKLRQVSQYYQKTRNFTLLKSLFILLAHPRHLRGARAIRRLGRIVRHSLQRAAAIPRALIFTERPVNSARSPSR